MTILKRTFMCAAIVGLAISLVEQPAMAKDKTKDVKGKAEIFEQAFPDIDREKETAEEYIARLDKKDDETSEEYLARMDEEVVIQSKKLKVS